MCRHIRWEDSLLSKEESREQEEFVFFQADMPFCTKVFLWVCPHACVTSQASFVLCFFSTAKDKSWMRLRCESFFFWCFFNKDYYQIMSIVSLGLFYPYACIYYYTRFFEKCKFGGKHVRFRGDAVSYLPVCLCATFLRIITCGCYGKVFIF